MKKELLILSGLGLVIFAIAKNARASNPTNEPAKNTSKDKLSAHFTLAEMLHSNTANAKGYDEQYKPSAIIIENLRLLAVNVLEPVRNLIGQPIKITSGYRCERTNKDVGGVSNSQHKTGQAADMDLGSIQKNKMLFDKIKNSNVPFDQLIDEKNFAWVHVSFNKNYNRRQVVSL